MREPSPHAIYRKISDKTIRINIRRKGGGSDKWILSFTPPGMRQQRIETGTVDLQQAITIAERIDYQAAYNQALDLQDPAEALTDDPRLTKLAHWYTDTWLPNLGRKPASIDDIAYTLEEFILWAKTRHIGRVSQLSPIKIQEYTKWLRENTGNSARTIEKKLSAIRAALNAAQEIDMIPQSPISKWRMPEFTEAEIDFLTPDQLRDLLIAIQPHCGPHWPAIQFIAATGNRPSGARTLLIRHIDLDRQIIHRPEVKVDRLATYPINTLAIHAIHAALDQPTRTHRRDSLIFLHPKTRQPYGKNTLYNTFTRAITAAGLTDQYNWVNLKTLRHTFGHINANYPIHNGAPMPLPMLQQCMGHSDIKTTMKYIKPADAAPYLQGYATLITPQTPNQ
jgi:integrase